MRFACLICHHDVRAEDHLQHHTGDYHITCFASIGAAALSVDRWTDEPTKCSLCQQQIARGAVIIRPADLVVHLRCFFEPPREWRKSVGAAAARATLAELGMILRYRSRLLRQVAMRNQIRARRRRQTARSRARSLSVARQ
jgi:hypothetical protein